MPTYQCENCLKKWSHKSNYIRHLNRKNKCQKIKNVLNLNIEKYDTTKINEVFEQNIKIIEQNKSLKKENKKIMKSIDKLVKNNIDLVNRIDILEKKNNENCGIHVSENLFMGQNNFNAIAFGYEEWSFLTNEQKLKILDGGFKSVDLALLNSRYVQSVHMNKDKPEYNNIYVKNWIL
jgi:hypothetical protein